MATKDRWIPVADVPVGLVLPFSQLRAVPLSGGRVQLQKLEVDQWKDITDECHLMLVKSQQSSGYYAAIRVNEGDFQGTKTIARFGFPIGDNQWWVCKSGYKIEKVPDGTISFRIFKKAVA